MKFIIGLKKVILDLKIYYRINFIYPSIVNYKKIKSIVPNNIKSIGNDVVVEKNVEFGSYLENLSDGLYIGENTYIGYCKQIGKYTSISYDVKIGLMSHPLNYLSTSPIFYSKRRGWVTKSLYNEQENGIVEIGNDVLISANAVILAGVKIGNGAVIGAGAIVNKDVSPYAIVAGVPAKLIKYRFSDNHIATLENSKWWDLPKNELLKFENSFNSIDNMVELLNKKTNL